MKRSFLWTAPAFAAALWLGGSNAARAQSIDADTAADAAADTSAAADAAADASSSNSTAESADAADSGASSDTSSTAGSTTATDSSISADTSSSGSASTQSSSQATTAADASASQDASISAGTQTPAPPTPSAQPNASVDANVDASATTDASQPENATQPSGSAASADSSANVDASLRGQAGLNAGAQTSSQQNLQAGLDFGQATARGLAINNIARNHFFYNSGLRQGDVLVSYAGRPIRSQADFGRWVMYQPGQHVPVVVLREGRPQTIYVVYEQQHGIEHQAGFAPGGAYLGVTFDPQSPQQAIVRTVSPSSPADQAGIRPGDVIFAVNGNQVGGSQDVIRMVSSMRPGEPIDVAISRQVVLGNRPGVAQATAYAPDVRIQQSAVTNAVPVVPAPAVRRTDSVETGAYIENGAVVPGAARYDNTPARAGDSDRDGRVLDGDGRVGPAEGRAVLPRRRN